MKRNECILKLPDNGYVFAIFPSKNKSQPLGQSTKTYYSFQECSNALDHFIDLVSKHRITDHDFVKVKEHCDTKESGILRRWTFHFYDTDGSELFARTTPYCQKASCAKGIQAVVRYAKELEPREIIMNENQYEYNESGCPRETSVDDSNTNSTTTSISPTPKYNPTERKLIKISLIMIIFGLLPFFAFGETGTVVKLLLMLLPLAAIAYSIYERSFSKAQARAEEKRRFESGEMVGAERAQYIEKEMRRIEAMYYAKRLTLMEYELLKKKYTGRSTLLDHGGLAFTAAASQKIEVERAISAQQKRAERELIFNASVGSAINGTAGAIIGAAASARKSAGEAAALESQRAAAEQNYRKALDDIAKL